MHFNVSHLVKAPIGLRDVVQLDEETVTLGDDLFLHHLRGNIELTRSIDGLLAEGQLDVAFDSECVRCLTLFPLSLTVQFNDLTFAFPHIASQDYLYHVSEDGWMDVSQALREQILLNTPFRSLCHAECRGLCSQCGQNLNNGTCDCQKQIGDPRLVVLSDLL